MLVLIMIVVCLQTLAPRIVTRLRALILLPTRDLVAQVRETFDGFSKGTGLKVSNHLMIPVGLET